jgi:outer membrane protein OmpA-like peptidoglycan-associated protein
MLKYLLVLLCLSICCGLMAQKNLVPNPSFEIIDGKPKKTGEIDKATPWMSPSNGTAEIFWSGSKVDEIRVPLNTIGFQHPRTGDNYAGAIFYDKKNSNLREYLQVELKEPLEKNKIYCIEFYVSIADLSKYSIDRIGAHISDKKISAKRMEPIDVVPQVLNKFGRLLADQVNWQIVCGEYKSKGGEKYLTIGNFFNDKQIQIGRMRKPRSVEGSQNEYGYYFIDDVSVIKQDSKYSCDCPKKINKTVSNIIYSKVSGGTEERLQPEDLIESKIIHFEINKKDLNASAINDLALILKLLEDNNNFTLDIVGFAESSEEFANADLALQRAQKIAEYFTKNGIRADRLIPLKGEPSPTEGGRLKKAEFSITIN